MALRWFFKLSDSTREIEVHCFAEAYKKMKELCRLCRGTKCMG